jgi:hypothetical protein
VSLAGSTDVCASRSEFNSCDLYPLEEARGATRSSGLSSAHESGGPSPVLHEMCVHSLGPGLKGQSHQGRRPTSRCRCAPGPRLGAGRVQGAKQVLGGSGACVPALNVPGQTAGRH